MNFIPKNSVPNRSYSFDDGLLSILSGDWQTAFIIFSSIYKQDKSLPVVFNLGLIYKFAKDTDNAINCFEEAISKLPQLPMTRDYNLSQYERLGSNMLTYDMPMIKNICEVNPTALRDRIIRLLVDLYLETGNLQKVIQYATKLEGKNYANIKYAKEKAEGELNDK